MGGNLIVLVEGKCPLSPQVNNKSAPKVNLNFHKCEKGLLCSPCLIPSLTKSTTIGALKIKLLRNWHYSN